LKDAIEDWSTGLRSILNEAAEIVVSMHHTGGPLEEKLLVILFLF